MIIRKGTKKDIDSIEKIYENIHSEEEDGLAKIGWIRGVYPTRKTAEDALIRKDLFVLEDEGKVVSAGIINSIQVNEYQYASWKHDVKDNEILVFHCLVVDPVHKSKGYGRAFISFYENYAKKNGYKELRIDTNAKNEKAKSLYQRLGYEEISIVDSVFNGIPDVKLVCLEKYIG